MLAIPFLVGRVLYSEWANAYFTSTHIQKQENNHQKQCIMVHFVCYSWIYQCTNEWIIYTYMYLWPVSMYNDRISENKTYTIVFILYVIWIALILVLHSVSLTQTSPMCVCVCCIAFLLHVCVCVCGSVNQQRPI